MDEVAARKIVQSSINTSNKITTIFRSIDPDRREERLALAEVIYEIYEYVIYPILNEFPPLKKEIEDFMNGPPDQTDSM